MSCEKNNNIKCPCTYSCPKHGKCCECIRHHLPNQFPACFFSKEAEATYDRSLSCLVNDRNNCNF